ncbi:transglutaminase family protein [Nocardioides acrostichi]|uniref:Transglutaminase family protein n=1 Tax=Nocardioides acrostichi TaxID=2784339 RepID=A0A930UWX5_9ACTN|nr:transglutaminase family protein [Nocardioides acrostichi]MBF4161187.1 transglutaminase family protein [Nocardioides acrostichi]
MRYRVLHRTTYSYDADVGNSYGQAYVRPRPLPFQHVDACAVTITPTPGDLATGIDCYGNQSTYFQVSQPHRQLVVEATSDVEVVAELHGQEALATPWERARPLLDPTIPGAWSAAEFAVESELVQHSAGAREYAASSLRPGRALAEAATDLMHRVYADFHYDPEATTVTSTIGDVLEKRAGVCQDFAHLMLAGLRAHGVAARYVSGYLATDPPPGKERIFGADASHAWLAVWLPTPTGPGEWLALDPTNDQWVGERYVTVAWGRDYGDVPPVKGVIFTDAEKSTLDVQVDVAPVAGEGHCARAGEPGRVVGQDPAGMGKFST